MRRQSFLNTIPDPKTTTTIIDNRVRFPELADLRIGKYEAAIDEFYRIIMNSSSSADVLRQIRSAHRNQKERMALLKIFRRCISPVVDTELSKKIKKCGSEKLIELYGHTFKPITQLQREFSPLKKEYKWALASLLGEYDTRGRVGYELTRLFFEWFEQHFAGRYEIEGPRGAGRDIELRTVFPKFPDSYPCDFVLRRFTDNQVVAIGFARYDSTRGGAQSDDRTGGNANKVEKAQASCDILPERLKLIFLADGPGLWHSDTWEEACKLDGRWDGRVRVVTQKLAAERITAKWLEG